MIENSLPSKPGKNSVAESIENTTHLIMEHDTIMNGIQTILLIDDDVILCESIKNLLSQHGFCTIVSHDSQNIDHLLRENAIDLVLLDIILPGSKDGITICKSIRQLTSAPIIMLTGIEADVEKIVSLEVGADHYITKPFNSRVLIAQIHACLRRHQHKQPVETTRISDELVDIGYQVYEFLGWRLNTTARVLLSPMNKIIKLTSAEFILLQALLQRPQCVLTRDQLLDVINVNSESFDRSIDILISRLRSKMETNSKNSNIIKTIRNAGYLLSCSVSKQSINSKTWQNLTSNAN